MDRNKKHHISFVLVLVLLMIARLAYCQSRHGLSHHIDSMLTARYQRTKFDTNYVTRPQTKWTLTGRLNVSGARITAKGDEEGQQFESEMTAAHKSTVSIGVSYLGLSLNLSVNPAKLFGKYRDYELGARSYGGRFGFDLAYHDAHNFKGWQELEGVRQNFTTSEEMFHLRTLNVNGYYVFNNRRFSYPAAFSCSYIQRRSAGSFLLAASGQGQHGEVNGETPIKFKMTNIGVGAGYGYNYVPGRGWLLHLSALPTFIVYTNTSLSMGDTDVPLHYHFPEVIITARSSVVKQIGGNKFAGLSMVYNFTSIGNSKTLTVQNEKWNTRLFFGFRL